MTNKLPVVGKRYKIKNSEIPWDICEIIDIETKGDTDFVNIEYEYRRFKQASYEIEIFNECFEELPEDKAETKPENQSHISELSPEVKQVMGDLKVVCNEKVVDGFKIRNLAEQLIDALGKQFMSKEEDKIDTSSEVCLSNNEMKPDENGSFKHLDNAEEISQDIMKEESIWKPVSELPEDNCSVIIKAKGGDEEIFFGAYREDNQHFMDELMKFVYPKKSIDKYCTLKNFINDYEKLKERDKQKEIRLIKLEERVKKLEGK